MQVSTKERQQNLESKFREIASIVCDKCVNTETSKPFPLSVIESTMKEIHFNVQSNKNAKQQAIALIRELESSQIIPISRATMRIRIDIPKNIGKKIKSSIEPLCVQIEKETFGIHFQMVCVCHSMFTV